MCELSLTVSTRQHIKVPKPNPPKDSTPVELGDPLDCYRAEAKKVLKTWRKLEIDWRKEFPEAAFPPEPEALDTVNDLMNLPVPPQGFEPWPVKPWPVACAFERPAIESLRWAGRWASSTRK